jgi:predicted nucleic acid-binding protein
MRFVDTNVLLYAVSTVEEEEPKARIARAILDEADIALSAQVLQEFYVQATHGKRHEPLTHRQAASLIDAFIRFPVQATTAAIVVAALETRERYQISYWDAAIVEAARILGCQQVLSEDLAHGQDYGGVRVANPFLGL